MATIDRLEIKHPCSASWAAMDGDARARFCKLCSKVVHDTTALTTCELEKMLDAPAPPCLRVHRDAAGRVLTRDRLAALAFAGLAACSGGAELPGAGEGPPLIGDVAADVAGETVPRSLMGELLHPSPESVVMGRIVAPEPPAPLMGVPLPMPAAE